MWQTNGYSNGGSYGGAAAGGGTVLGSGAPVGNHTFELTADEYRRKHELTVTGDSTDRAVPDPLQTFESAGFPRDIMDEVALLTTQPSSAWFRGCCSEGPPAKPLHTASLCVHG